MTKSEQAAVVRLIRHMQSLQRQIAAPTKENATEEEVVKIINLLWCWTPRSTQPLPRKHTIENLVGLLRGSEPLGAGCVSATWLAEIIRKSAENSPAGPISSVELAKGWRVLTNKELYERGRWNYQATSLVPLLVDYHVNNSNYLRDGTKLHDYD